MSDDKEQDVFYVVIKSILLSGQSLAYSKNGIPEERIDEEIKKAERENPDLERSSQERDAIINALQNLGYSIKRGKSKKTPKKDRSSQKRKPKREPLKDVPEITNAPSERANADEDKDVIDVDYANYDSATLDDLGLSPSVKAELKAETATPAPVYPSVANVPSERANADADKDVIDVDYADYDGATLDDLELSPSTREELKKGTTAPKVAVDESVTNAPAPEKGKTEKESSVLDVKQKALSFLFDEWKNANKRRQKHGVDEYKDVAELIASLESFVGELEKADSNYELMTERGVEKWGDIPEEEKKERVAGLKERIRKLGDAVFASQGIFGNESGQEKAAPYEPPAPTPEYPNRPTSPERRESSLDALGYESGLDYKDYDPSKPRLKDYRPASPEHEESAAQSRSFAEWVLSKRRFASDRYVREQADKRNLFVNSHWFKDVRKKMGIGYDPRKSATADAYYRLMDYAESTPEEIASEQTELEAKGKLAPSIDGIAASRREKELARNRRRLDALDKPSLWNKMLGDERIAAKRERLESERAELEKPIPTRADRTRERARASAQELFAAVDPDTGTIRPGAKLSERLRSVLNAKKREDFAVALGKEDEEDEKNRPDWGKSGFRTVDRLRYAAQIGRQRGEFVGKLGGQALGKLGTMVGGRAGMALAGAGSGLAAAAGPVGAAIFGVAEGVKQLVGIGKKIYSAAQKSLQKSFELAPYNGRLGAAKAMFEGRQFQRDVKFAADTADKRIALIEAQNEFLDATLELKTQFANLALLLQEGFIKWLKEVMVQFGGFTKRAKEDPIKEGLRVAAQSQPKTLKDALAREARRMVDPTVALGDAWSLLKGGATYGYGKSLQSVDSEAKKKEQAQAEGLAETGDLLQSYEPDGGMRSAASANRREDIVLSMLERSIPILVGNSTEQTSAAKETAQNTRKEKNNATSQAIFKAMIGAANAYKPTGGERAGGDGGNSWGASQEKQYGRFASERNVSEWGRK